MTGPWTDPAPQVDAQAVTVGVATVGSEEVSHGTPVPAAGVWRSLLRRPLPAFGFVVVVLLLVVALVGHFITPYPPNVQHLSQVLQAPSARHWLGTDELGRDVLSRILGGTAGSLGAGALIVLFAMAVGVPLGLVSGYLGGFVDDVLMRIMDATLAFPGLVLALAVAWVLGPSLLNAVLAVSIVTVPQFARVSRGQALVLRKREFVEAARVLGARPAWVLLRHILTNAATPIVVLATLNIGTAILAVASLSFLGLGPPPPAPNWGAMAQEGAQYLSDAPWISFFPGLTILLAGLGFNLLGDGLRDVLDPTSRR